MNEGSTALCAMRVVEERLGGVKSARSGTVERCEGRREGDERGRKGELECVCRGGRGLHDTGPELSNLVCPTVDLHHEIGPHLTQINDKSLVFSQKGDRTTMQLTHGGPVLLFGMGCHAGATRFCSEPAIV